MAILSNLSSTICLTLYLGIFLTYCVFLTKSFRIVFLSSEIITIIFTYDIYKNKGMKKPKDFISLKSSGYHIRRFAPSFPYSFSFRLNLIFCTNDNTNFQTTGHSSYLILRIFKIFFQIFSKTFFGNNNLCMCQRTRTICLYQPYRISVF